MATVRPNGVNIWFDSNGKPLAFGTVETFSSGTSVHLPTFNDAAETSPKENPFTLDASGRATIFWDGTYKVVVKSFDGSTVETIDPLAEETSSGDTALRADLAIVNDATQGAALIGVTPATGNEQPITMANFIVGKIVPARKFGVVQDGSDQTAALKRAAASGRYVEFVEGDMLVSDCIAMSQNGGGFFGVGGTKTRFFRNFSGTGLPVIFNNYGARVMLRDFYVGCTGPAYPGLVEGDNGVQMGQGGNNWEGCGDLTNLFIQGQWRGMVIFRGPIATIMAPQIEYCKNDAITTIDGACSIINGKLQFNAGNGIFLGATNPSACNLTVSNTTTYYNGGKSIYAPGDPSIHSANLWVERHCSSFDNGGGIFIGNHDQLKMMGAFVEYAGGGAGTAGPTSPFTGAQVNWGMNAGANGIVLTDGCNDAQLFGAHALYNAAAGVTLHGTHRTMIVGLDAVDNGFAYGSGAPARSGLVIQNGNTDLNLSAISCKGGYSDGSAHGNTFAQLYGLTVSTNDNTGVIDCGPIDRYTEEVLQTTGALRINSAFPVAPPYITAAYTISPPLIGDDIVVTGGTNVQQISPSWTGRRINVVLDTNNKIVRGVNVKLNGSDFVGAVGASIDLQYDGSFWQERGRVVNG